jgi:protein tyrosine phosphatase (PTP) superfamily phosphohydrolase (DUF442 family)
MRYHIAIVGSRDYPYPLDVYEHVQTLSFHWGEPFAIVSGGAAGVDTFAKLAAEGYGIKVIEHKPEWEKYGKAAAFIRNQTIVDDSGILYAFMTNPDKGSRGTKDSVRRARQKGIPVLVYCACHSKWHDVSTEPLKHTPVVLREPNGTIL